MPARGGDVDYAPGAPAADPPGTHRLFVACGEWWRGSFPLSVGALSNPANAAAPYALIFGPRGWTPIPAVRALWFRG